jgi:two-component system, LytTR family, sensor kinase
METFQQLRQSWFYRHKLYHIPFWCFFTYIWWSVAAGNPGKTAYTILFTPLNIKYLLDVVFAAGAVYLNLYVLMPRFFKPGMFMVYFPLLLATIAGASVGMVAGYYASAFASGQSLAALYGDGSNCFYYFVGYAFPMAFASMTLAMTIRLTKDWIRTERRQQQMEREKLETELNFLKQQFNPHFLFNSINSIFFLIHDNPNMASSSLAKFSELLRHQLYECNDQQIPLGKEINYLKNYIELERLRQDPSLKVTLNITAAYADHLGIAPFILMTFVENAFKHVSSADNKSSWITIDIDLKEDQLTFMTRNSVYHERVSRPGFGGIGLQNVRRRLDLVYPGKSSLDIHQGSNAFEIRLTVTLRPMMSVPVMKIA